MFIASILGAFSVGGISTRMDLDDIGVKATDLFNPSFYTVESLQNILKNLSPLFFVLLGGIFVSSLLYVAVCLFVGSPVLFGYERFNLSLVDGETPTIKSLFCGFSPVYFKTVLLRVLRFLLDLIASIPMIAAGTATIFLFLPAVREAVSGTAISAASFALIGIALLILSLASIASSILSIIINLRYGFAFVILSEYPELSAVEALQKSASLMRGNKWKLFCLNFSFIGWILLSVLSCGIGFIWITPYMNVANIAFYDEVANRKAAAEAEFPSLDPDDYTDATPTNFS